jgi:hypothetical protein
MKKNVWVLLASVFAALPANIAYAQDSFSDEGMDEAALAPEAPEVDDVAPSSSEGTNQVYAIRQGDTMWDICKIVLDNPWYWPKLWSLNQYILNPNLIYPGNQLVFSPATDTTFPKFEVVNDNADADMVEFGEEDSAATTRVLAQKSADTTFMVEESKLRKGETLGVKLRSISVVSPKGIRAIGKIPFSVEPKLNLMFGDRVYLKFYENMEVKIGDKFRVIEKVKTVFDPDRETRKIGVMIRKKATVTVVHIIQDKRWKRRVVEAVISDGESAVLRDDEIVPFESDIKTVIPHFTDKEIYGKIVEADHEQFLISNNDYVFLNIGTKDGLQPGLQLYVVRRGDGVLEENAGGLPDVPIARILVLETFEKTSTAYVTTLDRPLSLGDRVRSQVE